MKLRVLRHLENMLEKRMIKKQYIEGIIWQEKKGNPKKQWKEWISKSKILETPSVVVVI